MHSIRRRNNGFVKLLIGLFSGAGIGLLVIEGFAYGKSEYWQGSPPDGLFIGVGIGALSAALIWYSMFFGFGKRSVT